jgi:hypothetical protein
VEAGGMCAAVYNSAIPNAIPNMVKCRLRSASELRVALQLLVIVLGLVSFADAADWSAPEQQLAQKILTVTGPAAVALTVENRSSLGRRDNDAIQNGLRAALAAAGLRLVKVEQAAASVVISLSENPTSYVWVAEIRRGEGEATVVMVSMPRAEGSTTRRDSVPLSLRKIPLWTQDDPILDIAVLEESATPMRVAVLDPEKVSLNRLQGGKWQQEQILPIAHARPWPRDLRGRLILAKDNLLDVYLPGVICRGTTGTLLALNCGENDDPWPLVAGMVNGSLSVFPSAGLANGASTLVPQTAAFFDSARNFFTGALAPGVGKFTVVPKFYSAAPLPREKYTLWLFSATDGQVHIIDGVSEQVAKPGWGSDLASVKTSCGAGWQVLATSSGDGNADSVRAYEFPDRDPVAVSAALEFTGAITALWTEAKGDTAVAVVRDRETGSYEAFRLALACSQ